MSGRFYAAARKTSEKVLGVVPPMLELAKRAEEHVKGMVTPGTLFEEFGFNYIGPIDGPTSTRWCRPSAILKTRWTAVPARRHPKRQRLRACRKGPILYHGVTKFDPDAGITAKSAQSRPTRRFWRLLCDMADWIHG